MTTVERYLLRIYRRELHHLQQLQETYGFQWNVLKKSSFQGCFTGKLGKEEIYFVYDRRMRIYQYILFPVLEKTTLWYIQSGILTANNSNFNELRDECKRDWLLFLNKCLIDCEPNSKESGKLTRILIESC